MKVTAAVELPWDRQFWSRSYDANHLWLRNHYGLASDYACEGGCQGRAKEWAWVHDTRSYVPLCWSCHRQYDFGKPKKLKKKNTHRHDVIRWGRTKSGQCYVCNRIARARRSKLTVCQSCGYGTCRCNF